MSQGSTHGVPIDTDGTLAANSDLLVPSQKAVKTYADTKQSAGAAAGGDLTGTYPNPTLADDMRDMIEINFNS